MDAEEAFGQALRVSRQKKKWSQETLAFEAGIDRNYLSLIELGKNSPSIKVVFKLCQALGTTPSEMIRETERRLSSTQNDSHRPSI